MPYLPNKDSKRSKRKIARNIDINSPDLNKRFHKRAKRVELTKNRKPA